MPTITKLSFQKSGKRVNLYLDGKFFCGLTLSVVLEKNLKIGQALSEKQITTLVNKSLEENFFQKAANFISYRPRSEKEVKLFLDKKLKKHSNLNKKLKSTLVKKSINKLKKKSLLDDEKFTDWWIDQRIDFRPKGKLALKAELIKKGIKRETIDQSLKKISTESEIRMARKIFQKTAKRLKSLNREKQKQKLASRLAYRGFSWKIIKKLIDESNI